MTPTDWIRHVFALAGVMAAGLWLGQSPAAAQAPATPPTVADVRIGLGGAYKLGCWTPLEIELQGGSESYTGRVVVTVPDSDGVPTTIASPADRPVGLQPGQTTIVRMFVRIGQANSALQVRFVADGKPRCERTFYAGPEPAPGIIPGGMPATGRLMLVYGPAVGLGELVHENPSGDALAATHMVRLDEAAELPTRWFGYEGVDTVLLATSEPEIYRPLLQNPVRLEALRRWLELGGQLVVFCGREAGELLADGGALAEFVPGKYVDMMPLRQSLPLQTFSGAEQPVTRDRRLDLRVPRLVDVRGQTLAYADSQKSDLPLVIRSRLGLGELVFVGLDLDRPPLRDWPGRSSFLRKVLHWSTDDVGGQQDQRPARVSAGSSEDLIGQLHNALDSQFAGVQVVPFAWVALLVVAYIGLIGPGDYYLVKKLLRRPELTWVTFPLIVVGVSTGAYGLARWMKGDQLRVNQVEIVDVDTTSGLVRGTVWTHFFTPQVDRYDLTLRPAFFVGAPLENAQRVVAWLGLPGYALGAMQTSSSQTSVFETGYAFSDALDAMRGLPVQVWSTKTICARWTAQVAAPLDAELRQNSESLIQGRITNRTGVELQDCLLLYGRWAYHLGRLPNGATFTIDGTQQPRTVKTMLTRATAGDTTVTTTSDDDTVPFQSAGTDVARLAKVMMFYEAIHGRLYTNRLNRYQSFVDLSHLLQEDQALLLARCPAPGSQWFNGDQPLQSEGDRRWTYYRLLFPVQEKSEH